MLVDVFFFPIRACEHRALRLAKMLLIPFRPLPTGATIIDQGSFFPRLLIDPVMGVPNNLASAEIAGQEVLVLEVPAALRKDPPPIEHFLDLIEEGLTDNRLVCGFVGVESSAPAE
ncbi:MAG TPA: hypothetical protein VMS75_06720 [Terriglobales bacterium]|nr:hypothetical protein [Terriglobales bacterium]